MDKFGIFNLISSFYDFYLKNKKDKSNDKPDNIKNNSFGLSESSAESNKNENDVKSTPSILPPLKQSMINTIKNHDDFVKRVMENNKNTR